MPVELFSSNDGKICRYTYESPYRLDTATMSNEHVVDVGTLCRRLQCCTVVHNMNFYSLRSFDSKLDFLGCRGISENLQ